MTNLDEIAHNTGRIALALEALAFVATGEIVSFDPEPPLPPATASPSRAASSDAPEPESITAPTPPSLQSGQEAPGSAGMGSKCAEGREQGTVVSHLTMKADLGYKWCPYCGAFLGESLTPAPDVVQGT